MNSASSTERGNGLQPEALRELIAAAENRQAIYSFLTRMYQVELEKETLKELEEKRNLFLRLAQDPEVQGTEFAEGFRTVAEFVAGLGDADLDAVRLELATEYAGLFLGVRQTLPHPSESAYESREHLIMQKSRDDVLEVYRKMGLEKVKEFTEPEDHIAIELWFMAMLSGKTVETLKSESFAESKKLLEVQKSFLNDHLARWVPKLAADIMKGAWREFYKAVAKITKDFVAMDVEVVSEMLRSLTSGSGPHTEKRLRQRRTTTQSTVGA
jgi:TorA maturation chaperone TorD